MKFKRRDFDSMDAFFEVMPYENDDENVVTVVHERNWYKCDIMTDCKSWKTALKRFFSVLSEPVFNGWYESMRECAENGMFSANDSILANHEANPDWCYSFGIECVDDGEWTNSKPTWYIFLNVRDF